MKVIESYWKDTAVVWDDTMSRIIRISDFPAFLQSDYAKFYSTKRKSVKNASDSSPKLISYASIFSSNFWIEVAWGDTITILSSGRLQILALTRDFGCLPNCKW